MTNMFAGGSESECGLIDQQISKLIECLAEHGFAVVPEFLDAAFVADLRDDVMEIEARGGFRPAGIGRNRLKESAHEGADESERDAKVNAVVNSDVRRDLIHWLETPPDFERSMPASSARDPVPLVQTVMPFVQARVHKLFDSLRLALNQELQMGLISYEAHYAIYEVGSFYGRHRDVFLAHGLGREGRVASPLLRQRALSLVLYLNDADWSADDGGNLRVYLESGEHLDVLPQPGQLVCFLSDRFDHEVLPTHRRRVSLTAWFHRR